MTVTVDEKRCIACGMCAYAAPEVVDKVLEAFMNQIQEAGVVDETGELSVFALLMNNWRAMLTSAIWGLIPFLFLPVLSLFVNGALVGLLGGWVLQRGGSLAFYCAGILPHGVFEIPALVLSAACGVYLCRGLSSLPSGPTRWRRWSSSVSFCGCWCLW